MLKPYIEIGEYLSNIYILTFLGFCISSGIAQNKISISELSTSALALTAVISAFKWKREIEYKEHKNDKKVLINK